MALKGLVSVEKKLRELAEQIPRAVGAAMYQEGAAIAALAVEKAPVDTSRMRASAYVTPPTQTGAGPVVEVGFGTEYAVYVHERTELRHPSGEAKFLEKALDARTSGYMERLAKRALLNAARGVGMGSLPASGFPPAPQLDYGAVLGPTRHHMQMRDRAARRDRVREKRRTRKAARVEQQRDARALRRGAGAIEKRRRRLARREQQSFNRKQRNQTKREAKRERKTLKKLAAAQKRRQRREAKRLNKLRRQSNPRDFDF
jgi:hypothetical protein